MMRMYVFLVVLGIVSPTLWGREDGQRQLNYAFRLDWEGQFTRVPEVARPLTMDTTLTIPQRGKSWMLLGHAYQQQGSLQEATTAFEQAIHLFKSEDSYACEYADALSMFATLYRDMGQLREAMQMEKRALSVYEREGDQVGIAIVCSSLADMSLSQKHIKDGRNYLARALDEAHRASVLDDDYFASTSSTQARLAELEGDTVAAVSGYQHSLALLEHVHGEQHPQVGWTLVRLGKAYAEAGDLNSALDKMRKGLSILGQTAGCDNVSYLAAELAYTKVLDASGEHAQARELRTKAQVAMNNFFHNQCVQCRISLAAFQ